MNTTGIVKWFDTKKGFGFIAGERGEDVFVHHTAIIGEGFRMLKQGETVAYEVETTAKGLKAVSVRHADEGMWLTAAMGPQDIEPVLSLTRKL